MARSILAVVAGLATLLGGVFVITWIVVAVMIEDPTAPPTPFYLTVNLAYSFAAAVVAGYVAGLVAGRAPVGHAAALAAGIFTLGFLGVARGATASGQPSWYPYAITVLGPLGLVLGGWLRQRRQASTE
jgi:hypothetical protein